VPGAIYEFKVEARNSVGYSLVSEPISILCAQAPDQPSQPVTTSSLSDIIITWDEPWTGGSIITSYVITFMHSDGLTYSEETSICDGSLAGTVSDRICTITSSTFTQAPFSHEWGSSIYVKVSATNVKGTSPTSISGNGAVIKQVPDAPLDLQNVSELTSGTTIGLTWSDGVSNGGSVVLDYQIA
jgi:hypothetical protein